ncbi:hypothetical protein RJ639_042467 [Escallonia herrerae]|uniref:Uncharacterized protein n=1 Tax=Escallonia herrerae TaxID=1293975 RepID=A0AA88WIH8_9ASTE|nr:hypothetical protein RJ639_042467 [Escallonia herrerae]
METSLISDAAAVAATHGLGFAKFLLHRHHLAGNLQISAVIFPVDAVAPPPVKSSFKFAPRKSVRKTRRTKRKSLTGGGSEGEDSGFFGDGGDGGGPFGGGGGGSGWSYEGFGGADWEDSSSSWSDPAFDVVYEVISWIVLSNCLHFAFKKVLRIVADGYGDQAREKVTPIC